MNDHATESQVSGMNKGTGKPVIAIIDGSNVAYQGQKKPGLRYLMAAIDEVVGSYQEVLVIVDANLRYKIDDKKTFEDLLRQGRIYQSPSGISADRVIIEFVRKMMKKGQNAVVISNDLGIEEYLPNGATRIPIFSADTISGTEVILFPAKDSLGPKPVDTFVGA